MTDAMIVGSMLAKEIQEVADARDAWKKEAKDWEKIAREAISKMQEKEMMVSGMNAIINAFKDTHKNSPLLADSDQRYADGSVKSIARVKFELAFDARGKELGIANPEKHRKN